MPLPVQPLPPASHLPLILPGWLLRHFSLRRLRLMLPLIALPPLINVPAGCCGTSCCAASILRQLSSRHRLSQRAGWLLRRLSSCRPHVCACEGQPTIRWWRCSSKGQLTVSGRHHPSLSCAVAIVCCCMSRVSPTAPRRHPHPHINKGWPTMPRHLIMIARAGGN